MASITRTEGVETTNTTEGYREAGTGTVLNESTPGLKTVERTAPQQKSVSKEDLGITLAFTIKNITLC